MILEVVLPTITVMLGTNDDNLELPAALNM
jgi:hypothetical protein